MNLEKESKTKSETHPKEPKDTTTLSVPKELQALLEAGVQFGHKKSAVHPGMFPYIFGVRSNAHIFDVEKTYEKLNEALAYIAVIIKEGKIILFVGTRMPVRALIQEAAQETAMPYIVKYWAGGVLTNWKTLSERVQYMKDLQQLQKSDEWEKYTKHERLGKTRELKKLEERWEGIQHMEKLPDAIFLVDMQQNALAAREARKLSIPIIAIVDTNINPAEADYVIPANDDSVSSVQFIVDRVKDTILKNKPKEVATATSSPEEEESK